jgi:tetratricopeptide (TPR) repeat protein
MPFLGYPEDSLQILEEGAKRSKELGDSRAAAKFYSLIGLYYSALGGEPQTGIRYSESCFHEAEMVKDVDLMVPTAVHLCASYHFGGADYFKMLDVSSRVIAVLEETSRQHESFGTANPYSLMYMYSAVAMDMLGDFWKGHETYERGLAFASEIGDLNAQSTLEMCEGLCLVIHKGDARNGVELLQNSIGHCEEGQVPLVLGMAQMGLGWGYHLLGELEAAREHLETGLRIQNDIGLTFYSSLFPCGLSMIDIDSGDPRRAQSHTEEALRLSQDNNEKWPEGLSRVLLGRALGKVAASDPAEAEQHILRGIGILREVGLKPLVSQCYVRLGEFYADTGQVDKAFEALRKAEAEFRDMGMDYWLRKTQDALASMPQ